LAGCKVEHEEPCSIQDRREEHSLLLLIGPDAHQRERHDELQPLLQTPAEHLAQSEGKQETGPSTARAAAKSALNASGPSATEWPKKPTPVVYPTTRFARSTTIAAPRLIASAASLDRLCPCTRSHKASIASWSDARAARTGDLQSELGLSSDCLTRNILQRGR